MARRPRLVVPGCPHYLQQHAVHGQVLAVDDDDRRLLLAQLGEIAAAESVSIWAYALLDDALHMIATPTAESGLGRLMQSLGRRYVAAFNRRHDRRGALWGGRFGAAVIQPGEYLLSSMTFVDGLVDPQHGCSSAAHRLGLRRDPLLHDPPELWTLGNTPFERELGYRARLDAGVAPELVDQLQRAVRGGWAVGSKPFVSEMTERVGRPVTARPRGRPPRQRG